MVTRQHKGMGLWRGLDDWMVENDREKREILDRARAGCRRAQRKLWDRWRLRIVPINEYLKEAVGNNVV